MSCLSRPFFMEKRKFFLALFQCRLCVNDNMKSNSRYKQSQKKVLKMQAIREVCEFLFFSFLFFFYEFQTCLLRSKKKEEITRCFFFLAFFFFTDIREKFPFAGSMKLEERMHRVTNKILTCFFFFFFLKKEHRCILPSVEFSKMIPNK